MNATEKISNQAKATSVDKDGKLRVILSGGGTGGHIFPAVAIANEIKKNVPDAEILFVGAEGKMEMEKVPAAGYKIIGIPIAGFQRNFSLANFKLPFLILKSLFKTKNIINEFKPHVVVGTGGYASGPLLRAAMSKNIPALIQEQNSYAGITNKILSKKAKVICVAYEGMDRFFPKEKIILTGNPIRQDILNIHNKKNEACTFFSLDPNKKTVLIVGGSLGAKGINEAILPEVEEFTKNNIQLIWQTGKLFFPIAQKKCEGIKNQGILVTEFISRMDLAYAIADCVISRAGAGAISELCIVKKASVLVPLPSAAEDHQTQNALSLSSKNAAILVKESNAKQELIKITIDLIKNYNKLNEIAENAGKMALQNATQTITKEVLKLANYQL